MAKIIIDLKPSTTYNNSLQAQMYVMEHFHRVFVDAYA